MRIVKLGEVAVEYKESFNGSKNGLIIVGLEHLIPEDVVLRKWQTDVENTFTKVFRKGSTLFGRRRAYLKKAVYAHKDGICSGDITVIKPIDDKIDPELLPFVIQEDHFFDYAVEKSAGSLSPRVKWEHLKNYEFLLGTIEEQRKLAKSLWSITNTIESYKDFIESSKALSNALLDKKLNEYPDLKYVALGTLVKYHKKSNFKAGEGKDIGDFPFFTSSNEQSKWVDDYLFDDECLIVGTGGVASVNYYNGKFAVSTDCFTLSSKNGYSMKFLYLYLLNKIDILQFGFRGVGLQHLSKDYLNSIPVPLLNSEQQDEILMMLNTINDSIKIAEDSLSKAKKLLKKLSVENICKKGD
jgi:type I restriction enzyme S subunit